MVNRIDVQNYKAFKNASIELKPITIFLGANSVGKSSIVKLLLMISQNVSFSSLSEQALIFNGDAIEMGSFDNLLHRKNHKSHLGLVFEVQTFEVKVLKENLQRQLHSTLDQIKDVYYFTRNKKEAERLSLVTDRDNIEDLIEFLQKEKNRLNRFVKSGKIQKEYVMAFLNRHRSVFNVKDNYIIYFDSTAFRDIYAFLSNIEQFEEEKVFIKYSYKLSPKKKVQLSNFSIFTEDSNILTYEKKLNLHIISSDYLDIGVSKRYSTKFGKTVNLDRLKISRNMTESNIFIDTLTNLIQNLLKDIESTFNYDSINHVDPLRAYPSRYYFLIDKENSSPLNRIDGVKMASMLKNDLDLKKKVNKWINKFKLKVNIENIKETIHNIKINQNNLNLDITDVGFGISQVLPIITQGFFSKVNSTTIVEQPEIHLHPKMQAELADLFIEMIHQDGEINKKVIIETHSEYLLKRLRRRISEGVISSKDVALYTFELNEKKGTGEIKHIEISEKGSFEWPKDFYDVEMEDTLHYLQNQEVIK